MQHIWYKLHFKSVFLFSLSLWEWIFWIYINMLWKGYFVENKTSHFLDYFYFFHFSHLVMQNIFTTRQVWLKLWIIIEPLCFSPERYVKPFLMPQLIAMWFVFSEVGDIYKSTFTFTLDFHFAATQSSNRFHIWSLPC